MRGGGGRSKSSGGFKTSDIETRFKFRNKVNNVSLFTYLQEGCFEKQLLSYCANRINDFSCVHWMEREPLNPEAQFVATKLQNMAYNSSLERRNLTAYLIANSVCYIDRHVYYRSFFNIGRIFIPILLFVALVLSVLSFIAMRRLGHTLLPLCIYVSYLATFDIIELIFRGGNIVVETLTHLKVISSVVLLDTTPCQMLPMMYNIFKHAQSALYIGLAIDTWRFVREPMRMFTVYRKEWIRNVFILSAALFMTVNSQFFWTFDVTENENKLIHARIVRESYECGFSTELPLNQIYVGYIWPLLDFMAGEMFPFVLTATFSLLSWFYMRKHKPNMNELDRFLINTEFVLCVNRTFTLLLLFYALFMFPRMAYVLMKYIIFSRESRKQAASYTNPKKLLANGDSNPFIKWLEKYESYMEIMEYFVKSLDFLFMIVKFLILVITLPHFRRQCSHLITFACFRKTKPKKADEAEQKLDIETL